VCSSDLPFKTEQQNQPPKDVSFQKDSQDWANLYTPFETSESTNQEVLFHQDETT